MKKLLIAILLAALLIIPVPGTALAAPKHAKHTITADMTVAIVGSHDLYPDPTDPYNFLVGTFNYAGSVTEADRQSKDWEKLEGATVTAQENVRYQYQMVGPYTILLSGTATGTITITASDHAVAVMTFKSAIDCSNYPFQLVDEGKWKTVRAHGFLNILKDAEGDWIATINPLNFTGTAHVTGTY